MKLISQPIYFEKLNWKTIKKWQIKWSKSTRINPLNSSQETMITLEKINSMLNNKIKNKNIYFKKRTTKPK
jgi:hypothetical protein